MDNSLPFNNNNNYNVVENQNAAAASDWPYFDEYTPLMPTWEQESAVFCESFNNCSISNILNNNDFDHYPIHQTQKQPINEDSSTISYLKVEDFDKICQDLNVWDYEPLAPTFFQENGENNNNNNNNNNNEEVLGLNNNEEEVLMSINNNGKSHCKKATLEFDEIKKYFDLPITKAAKELRVGLTALKKRCRELNISRWPHRRLKSLRSLIHNAKELGMGNEIEMLEEHKRMVESIPEMELTERTKKLRQACFKANYKKRMALAASSH